MFVYLLFWSLPYAYFVPYGEELSHGFRKLVLPIVRWFASVFLGLDGVQVIRSGSGDTSFDWAYMVLGLLCAGLAAAAWTALSRQKSPSLGPWLRVFVRYGLGSIMIVYGMIKIFPLQFSPPEAEYLVRSFGDSTPRGLLWYFMGQSTPYVFLTGCIELTGGLLLFFRRTTLLGALILAGALVNVVALNFAYDVPVKIFSSHLLVASLYLIWPARHRLLAVLVAHKAAPPDKLAAAPLPEHLARFRPWIKLAIVGVILVTLTWRFWSAYDQVRRMSDFPLAGVYDVTHQTSTPAKSEEVAVVSISSRKRLVNTRPSTS